jgi:hypothetical protein
MKKSRVLRILERRRKMGLHPVDQVYGILKLPKSVDALIDEMRGRAEPQRTRRDPR